MDLFELIGCVKDLTAAIKAGDWKGTFEHLGHLCEKAAGLFDMPVMGTRSAGEVHPDLDSAEADLKACGGESRAVGADPVGLDPATVLVIIELVTKIIGRWRNR